MAFQAQTLDERIQSYAEVPSVGDVDVFKKRIPDTNSYSSIELLKYAQDNGISVLKCSETSLFVKECDKNKGNPLYDSALRYYLEGNVEVQATIIAWPGPDGYSERIIPANKKSKENMRKDMRNGEDPLMLEDFTITGKEDYTLKCATVQPLKVFPKESDYLQEEIPELGLPKGAYVWSNPDFDKEQGLRALLRGYWYWHPDERHFHTNAYWGPSESDSLLAFRSVRRIDDFVKIEKREYEALLRDAEMFRKIKVGIDINKKEIVITRPLTFDDLAEGLLKFAAKKLTNEQLKKIEEDVKKSYNYE